MQFSKLSIALDQLAEHYSVSQSAAAWILSSVGFMGIVFGAAAGAIVGVVGVRKSLLAALTIGIIASAVQATLPSMPLMIGSRLVEGVSHLMIVVSAPTAIISSSAERHKAITMGLWATFFGVAFALTGLVGPFVLERFGLSGLFAFHAAYLAILLGVYLSLKDTVKAGETASLRSQIRDAWSRQFQVYRSLENSMPALVFLWHTLMFVALLTFLPAAEANESRRAWLIAALPIVSIVGSFSGGAIAQKIQRPLLQMGVSLATFAASAAFVALSLGGTNFWLMACIMMFFSGIIQASVFASVPLLSRTEDDQAQANGAITQLGNLGATCGPPMFAFFIASGGEIAAPLLSIGLAGCAIVMLFIASRRKAISMHRSPEDLSNRDQV